MVTLAYRARDLKGVLVEGEVDGYEFKELESSLVNQGLTPVSIEEMKSGSFSFANLSFNRINNMLQTVKSEELIVFTRQFYTLFKAGLSMEIILTTLSKQCQNPKLKEALNAIRVDINSGTSIGRAFSKHPKIFDSLYTAMLSAGEEAGILEQVLLELTIVLEKQIEVKTNIKSATLYPKIVVGVMLVALYVLLTFVIPKFGEFYDKFGGELPGATRLLIGLSDFFSTFWWLILALVAAAIIGYKKYYSTYRGRLVIDALAFKIPIFGVLTLKVTMAQFGHLLSSLYKSGMSLPRCFEIMMEVISNKAFVQEIATIKAGIERGTSISEIMRDGQYFSPIVIETTAIGEKTGSLDEMLDAVANHYDLEVKHLTKNLTTMIEPILLCSIFGMVTVMLLAVAMPMWNLSKVVMDKA